MLTLIEDSASFICVDLDKVDFITISNQYEESVQFMPASFSARHHFNPPLLQSEYKMYVSDTNASHNYIYITKNIYNKLLELLPDMLIFEDSYNNPKLAVPIEQICSIICEEDSRNAVVNFAKSKKTLAMEYICISREHALTKSKELLDRKLTKEIETSLSNANE